MRRWTVRGVAALLVCALACGDDQRAGDAGVPDMQADVGADTGPSGLRWDPMGELTSGRLLARLERVAEDRQLILGHVPSAVPGPDAEVFEVGSGAWSDVDISGTRGANAAAWSDGAQLYVFGGGTYARGLFPAQDSERAASVRLPELSSESLEPLPTPIGRMGAEAAGAGDAIFVLGGIERQATPLTTPVAFRWSVTDGSWSTFEHAEFARMWHCAVPFSDHVVLIGGRTFEGDGGVNGNYLGDSLTSVVRVNADRTVESLEPLPTGVHAHACAELPGGDILVVGGIDSTGGVVANTYHWSRDTGSWAQEQDVPVPAAFASLLNTGGRIFLTGGLSSIEAGETDADRTGAASDQLLEYDSESGRWVALGALPEPRFGHATAVIDGRLLLAGGASALSPGQPPSLSTWMSTPL